MKPGERICQVRAHYTVYCETGTEVFIIDQDDGAMSVTNDADAVVAEVVKKHGDKGIIYRDSMGQWSELKHEHGWFTGYSPSDVSLAPPEMPF